MQGRNQQIQNQTGEAHVNGWKAANSEGQISRPACGLCLLFLVANFEATIHLFTATAHVCRHARSYVVKLVVIVTCCLLHFLCCVLWCIYFAVCLLRQPFASLCQHELVHVFFEPLSYFIIFVMFLEYFLVSPLICWFIAGFDWLFILCLVLRINSFFVAWFNCSVSLFFPVVLNRRFRLINTPKL